jgi:hypothetical protein
MGNINYKENLINYFKRNLKKGYPSDALKFALIHQGYSKAAVEEALNKVNAELAEKAPILREKPVIKYEVIDENDNVIRIKKSFWKRLFGG